MAFREMHDLVRQAEITALCVSAMAGNPDVDLKKANVRVTNIINEVFNTRFPYYKKDNATQKDEENYDKYFKYLEEMQKERERKKEEASVNNMHMGESNA